MVDRIFRGRPQFIDNGPQVCETGDCLTPINERYEIQKQIAEQMRPSRSQARPHPGQVVPPSTNPARPAEQKTAKKVELAPAANLTLRDFAKEFKELQKRLESQAKTDPKVAAELKTLDDSWNALKKIHYSGATPGEKTAQAASHLEQIVRVSREVDSRTAAALPKVTSGVGMRTTGNKNEFDIEVPKGSSIAFRWDYYDRNNPKSGKITGGVDAAHGYDKMGASSLDYTVPDNFVVKKYMNPETGNLVYRLSGDPKFVGRVQVAVNGVPQGKDLNINSLSNDHLKPPAPKVDPSIHFDTKTLNEKWANQWASDERIRRAANRPPVDKELNPDGKVSFTAHPNKNLTIVDPKGNKEVIPPGGSLNKEGFPMVKREAQNVTITPREKALDGKYKVAIDGFGSEGSFTVPTPAPKPAPVAVEPPKPVPVVQPLPKFNQAAVNAIETMPPSVLEGQSVDIALPADQRFAIKHPDGRDFIDVKTGETAQFLGGHDVKIERTNESIRISAERGTVPWNKSTTASYLFAVGDDNAGTLASTFKVEIRDEITKLPADGTKLVAGSSMEFDVSPGEEISVRREDGTPYTNLGSVPRSETPEGIVVERNGSKAKLSIPSDFDKTGKLELKVRDKSTKLELEAAPPVEPPKEAPKVEAPPVEAPQVEVAPPTELDIKGNLVKGTNDSIKFEVGEALAKEPIYFETSDAVHRFMVDPEKTYYTEGYPKMTRTGDSVTIEADDKTKVSDYRVFFHPNGPSANFNVQDTPKPEAEVSEPQAFGPETKVKRVKLSKTEKPVLSLGGEPIEIELTDLTGKDIRIGDEKDYLIIYPESSHKGVGHPAYERTGDVLKINPNDNTAIKNFNIMLDPAEEPLGSFEVIAPELK